MSMDAIATKVGYTVMVGLAVVATLIAVLLVADAIKCARFVVRRIRLLPNAGFKPEYPKYRTSAYIWWAYLTGKADRPICVYNHDTGIHAYWPGREDHEHTYPG